MPTRRASRELLAPVADVWRFIAEPGHLPDWWPNLATVEPDRRGFSVGARWAVRSREASWFRSAGAEDTLLVRAADADRRFSFELARARLRADLTVAPAGHGHSRADLLVSGPLFPGFPRKLPETALARLHDLVQTAADL